jgi:hypothetical protein
VSKSVGSKVPDVRELCRTFKFSPNAGIGIWQSAEFDRACKDPVLRSRKLGQLLAGLQTSGKKLASILYSVGLNRSFDCASRSAGKCAMSNPAQTTVTWSANVEVCFQLNRRGAGKSLAALQKWAMENDEKNCQRSDRRQAPALGYGA